MNSLNKIIQFRLLQRNSSLLCTAVRNAGAWNRDWKPGPYPKTQEEREAAAKKYGLHIKDYKPYPDDGTGHGDYPMLEPFSVESRNSFEHYDCPEFKRNFGEILHVDADMYTAERFDVGKKYLVPLHKQYLYYIGVISFFFFLYYVSENNKMIQPVMANQIPTDGKKYYGFSNSD
ncbi:UNVERIFIED_CONTAM: hypothetical protein GTU68_023928 [Idotea baltica]|nr:hypothetical protein [Idotea baltica]